MIPSYKTSFVRYISFGLLLSSLLGSFDLVSQVNSAFLDAIESDTFTIRSGFFGSQIYLDETRLNKKEILEIYSDYPSIYEEAKKGLAQRNVGNILGGLGLASVIYLNATVSQGDDWSDYSLPQKSVLVGALPILIGGLTFAIKGERKVIWSYKDFARTLDQAEEVYPVIGTRMYHYSRKPMKIDEVKNVMKDHPEAWDKYRKGFNQEKIGFITALASLGTMVGTMGYQASQYPNEASTPTLVVLGGSSATMLTGLIIGFIGSAKQTKALTMMSKECNCLVEESIIKENKKGHWALGYSNDGLGLTFTF